MKIDLEIFPPSCPLQVRGRYGEYGVYYRARHNRWDLWIDPEGAPIDHVWLGTDDRIDNPTTGGVCNSEQEDDPGFALARIAYEVESYDASRPTQYTVRRELVAKISAELRALAADESADEHQKHADQLMEMVEQLSANPVTGR